jgi:hypothetical protein
MDGIIPNVLLSNKIFYFNSTICNIKTGLETGVASGVENSTTTGIMLHFLIAKMVGIIFYNYNLR